MELIAESQPFDSAVIHATPDTGSSIREAIDGYALALLRLVVESYGQTAIERAWREFNLDSDAPFTADDIHCELFFSWLFHCWTPKPESDNKMADSHLYGIPPTRTYLVRHSLGLSPFLRRYLEACLKTPLGFYETKKCCPTIGFRAQDVSTGVEIKVVEPLASSSLKEGDIIFARIPFVDGIYLTDAIAPIAFPSAFLTQFSLICADPGSDNGSDRALRKWYFDLLDTYLCARLPEIRSGHGEIIERRAAYFSLGTRPCEPLPATGQGAVSRDSLCSQRVLMGTLHK